jgi:hypothetical protein
MALSAAGGFRPGHLYLVHHFEAGDMEFTEKISFPNSVNSVALCFKSFVECPTSLPNVPLSRARPRSHSLPARFSIETQREGHRRAENFNR